MRHAAACLAALLLCSGLVRAEGYGPALTVLLDLRQAGGGASVTAIQHELSTLLAPAGLAVEVKVRTGTAQDESRGQLVLVKMTGNCDGRTDPRFLDERGPGPLAFAHSTEAGVQPFAHIECDAVKRAVDSALWGGQRGEREHLFDRALGRVLAHEVVHMLGETREHGKSGVFARSLSGADLISEQLRVDPADCQRIRDHISKRD